MIQISSDAQRGSKDDAPVTFEELYDAPYDINQLFIGFQPMYGEMFVTNMNAGFGLDVTYFHLDQFRIQANARLPYTKKFDLERDRALRNSVHIVNYYDEATNGTLNRKGITSPVKSYGYYELGGTYHIKDFEKDDETKMTLYKKSYRGDKWASRVPKVAPIPCKVRQIYGVRVGGMYYSTSTDLSRAMKRQDVGLDQLTSSVSGTFVDDFGYTDVNDVSLTANIDAIGVYAGASMTWIHNVAVEFDNKYEPGVDDLILTVFGDLIVAPYLDVADIMYRDDTSQKGSTSVPYTLENVNTNIVGWRLGVEGKFNRTLGWSYGGEIGHRPSLKTRGFYALIKISVPVFSTNLKYEVEAFGK